MFSCVEIVARVARGLTLPGSPVLIRCLTQRYEARVKKTYGTTGKNGTDTTFLPLASMFGIHHFGFRASSRGAMTATVTRVAILVAFIAGHIGFPVLDVHEAIEGAAFPCQGHHCGCKTAEHCWSSCCCMPLSERLAWAETNRVAPPVEVVQAAESAVATVAVASDCCNNERQDSERHSQESESRISLRWITTIQAMKCRGHASYWSVAAEPALATSASLTCRLEFPEVGTISLFDEFSESWGSTPPVPPG